MKRTVLAAVAVACLLAPSTGDAGLVGVGARVSSLGLGVEAAMPVLPSVNVRGGVYGLDYSYDGTESGNEYEMELGLSSMAVLADVRIPFAKLRLTGGLVKNGNQLDARSTAGAFTYDIGGQIYSADDLGDLIMKVEFDDVAPYLGIGLGNPVGRGLGLVIDVGVMMQGSPQVSLTTERDLPEPLLQAELQERIDREEADLEDELKDFDTYPVISVGLRFGF